MDQLVTIQPAPTLRGFCQHIIAKHASNWPADEMVMAEEFVTFFKLDFLTTVTSLTELCKSLGVNVSHSKLPRGLHGHNCAYEDKREIVIAETAETPRVPGAREHTLLHELREIMEYEFRKINSPIASDLADREERAEDFACYVRAALPIKAFGEILEHMGQPKWTVGEACLAVIFGIAMIVYAFSCTMLPHWEDQLHG